MAIGKIAPYAPPNVPHGTSIVKIFVGPEKKELAIHKDLLCAASKHFDAAFNHGFAEGEDGVMNLPEEEPSRFQLFYDWLYSGRVVDGPSMYMTEDTQVHSDEFWFEIYHMADRLMIPALAEVAFHRLRMLFSYQNPLVPSREFIAALFKQENESLFWLEKLLAGHVSFWSRQMAEPWLDLVACNDRFGRRVSEAILHDMTPQGLRNPRHLSGHVETENRDEVLAETNAEGKKPVQSKLLKRAF